ncbi:MAG: bacteriophage holin [Kiloniellales bacterium]
MVETRYYATLGCISFGLAVGITAGVLVFLLGTAASIFGWGVPLAVTLASVFVGFGPTLVGSVAGAVWAFASGFFVGVLVAWLYNRLLLRRRRHTL